MHANCIWKLRVSNESPDVLADASPDCRQHLQAFMHGHATAYAMLNYMGFDGPPELFSMYACLFADKTVTVGMGKWPLT